MGQQWNKAFYDRIIAEIKETIINDCLKLMYETMQDMVYKAVYNQYTPTQYVRRYDSNGGLGDIGTYDFEINDLNSNGFVLRMYSNAMGNENYNGNLSGKSIDECIVEGNNYSWEKSGIYNAQPYPRDFYQATLNRLIDDGVLYGILIDKLKGKGINIK